MEKASFPRTRAWDSVYHASRHTGAVCGMTARPPGTANRKAVIVPIFMPYGKEILKLNADPAELYTRFAVPSVPKRER
jgi:hypothetical protein